MVKQIKVVGAAIVDPKTGHILIGQRGPTQSLAGMWEFPGGKIEPGETEPEALMREIQEELNLSIEVNEAIDTASYQYDFGQVTMTVYYATLRGGELKRLEHAEIRWVSVEELADFNWAPVDIPIVNTIIKKHRE
ncbi:(deoxy)nucleoside triphosphate pyrophosphohydrolase [Falseniella ignava]|uniref:8-oxo-dGTP diphosphatase n=2 Tax=Falseniella ignava TaxID=137730 RepID=K1LTY2_9LACT|nr:(deoxy)nucleoside triphosphate pyrophosphohydrolase [Falseniella ignava]EKB55582.1 mutator mutT protein [Falseniella ignava CCUG 37419]PKY90523.1 (deoxy)nucleoside triphosphate pyrophosphohydrolase [Falseniella ignava]